VGYLLADIDRFNATDVVGTVRLRGR